MQEQEIEAPQTTRQNSCKNVFPRDMVCLGNMCLDTTHIGDNNDDDDDNNNNVTIILMENTMLLLA